jgi:hypothetical protein
MLAIGGVALSAQAPRMKLDEVLQFTASSSGVSRTGSAYVFQADRGGRKGQYLHVETGKGAGSPRGDSVTEYRLLGPAMATPLPDVDVLGIHYLQVRPDRREAFESFVASVLHPAVGNLRPDLRLLYYKAVSGPDAGKYITIFALTRESRDKYWPGGSDADVLRTAFAPVKVHTKALLTYLVDGSANTDEKLAAAVYESRDWTDFVLVTPPR